MYPSLPSTSTTAKPLEEKLSALSNLQGITSSPRSLMYPYLLSISTTAKPLEEKSLALSNLKGITSSPFVLIKPVFSYFSIGIKLFDDILPP